LARSVLKERRYRGGIVTRRARFLLTMTLLVACVPRARAQEAVPAAPMPLYRPPPRYLVVDPVELEERGHRKKVAGAVLMGIGIGLTAIGVGLAIDGALHVQCTGHEEHAVCTPSFAASELQLGSVGAVVGQILTLVGIPVYIVGGRQVASARRLMGQPLAVAW
jgi:hypothetical protein